MVERLLAKFGYVKVPFDSVLTSISQENFFKRMQQIFETDSEMIALFKERLKKQEYLTQFLIAGRKVTAETEED